MEQDLTKTLSLCGWKWKKLSDLHHICTAPVRGYQRIITCRM